MIAERGDDYLDPAGFRDLIRNSDIDYIDFGCSKGGSLAFAKKRFGGANGLGIDIDQRKVDMTLAAGFEAARFDINEIPNEPLVRFVVMSHFLEHVPDMLQVKEFIRKACVISTEFVYIQQPFFDADPYLFEKGYKLFWSDWTGHPNRMTSLELWLALRDLKEEGLPITFSLYSYKAIVDSADPCVHPLGSPPDQQKYDVERHPTKGETVQLDNVYYETIGLITKPGVDHGEVVRKLRYDRQIADSNGRVYSAQTISDVEIRTTS